MFVARLDSNSVLAQQRELCLLTHEYLECYTEDQSGVGMNIQPTVVVVVDAAMADEV